MPRRLTPRSLENAALFYVRRYSCTEEGLRRVLRRKVQRASRAKEEIDEAQTAEWIDAIVKRFVSNGYVNDERFSKARAESLIRRGASVRKVQEKLKLKGVSADQIAQAVDSLGPDRSSVDQQAALAFARRRKLGPFRRAALKDAKGRAKELASFARAGFGFAIAAKIVDAKSEVALMEEDFGRIADE